MSDTDERPQPRQPTGPAEHLDTVEYWRELYCDAIAVGQAKVDAVRNVHRRRNFKGDGYGWSICVEDRQSWPCVTIVALDHAFGEATTNDTTDV